MLIRVAYRIATRTSSDAAGSNRSRVVRFPEHATVSTKPPVPIALPVVNPAADLLRPILRAPVRRSKGLFLPSRYVLIAGCSASRPSRVRAGLPVSRSTVSVTRAA